jgi:predicted house-cleaning NTP pyrophosphatase (Maf/HAM1 superfamily)
VRVLLASASERRFDWLNGRYESIELICKPLLTKEKNIENDVNVEQQSLDICFTKAESAALEWILRDSEAIDSPDLIIVSDTLVEDPGGKIALGKPKDKMEAASMLLRLSGKRHRVWSSTAILTRNNNQYQKLHSNWRYKIWTDYAVVEFDDLSEENLSSLVENNSWVGKAGGYDFAGEAGEYTKIIEGDEVTVLGFSKQAIDEFEATI